MTDSKQTALTTVNVDLGERSYPIHIGDELLVRSELLAPHISGNQVMIVTNTTVAPLYLATLKTSIESSLKTNAVNNPQVDMVILEDGEEYKDLKNLEHIFDALLEKQHNRSTTLIALGGGVVGDMTGFAAASYQRGVNFIQVPTTLLAQVDSSVGGKTAVNHPRGKNMIGAFYQPSVVIADTQVLKTLPSRELSAGMAEVIKYGYIWDAEFLQWLEINMSSLMRGDSSALKFAIERSCEIKAEVVSNDETEQGLRAILNFGHTFGHAIETEMGYGKCLHGEAVALGILLALDLSVRLSHASNDEKSQTNPDIAQAEIDRLLKLLSAAQLPMQIDKRMSPDLFLKHMAVDKKVIDKKLRLVLLKTIGKAVTTSKFSHHQLQQTLEESRYRAK